MIIGISGKIGAGKDLIAKIIQYLTTIDEQSYQYALQKGILIDDIYSDPNYNYEWKVKKFAGKLKEIVSLLINCSLEDLEDQEFKNTPLGNEWSIWKVRNEFTKITIPNKIFLDEEEVRKFCDEASNSQHHYTYYEEQLTPRKLLQLTGTEFGRELIHPNCWINSTFADYYQTKMVAKNDKLLPKWLITDVRFPNEGQAIKQRKGILIRTNRHLRFNLDDLYNLAMNKLDYPNPNMDFAHEISKKLDLDYDESTEEWIDVEDIHRGKEHESETSLDNYDGFDYIVENNGSIEELVEKVKQILIKEKII